jgi:hypothetical protein
VLGGAVVMEVEPSIVALANDVKIGGRGDDKRLGGLETPHDPDRMPSVTSALPTPKDLRRLELEGAPTP